MAILFYDHLITKSEIEDLICTLEEEENQKGKALQLIDDIIFQGIVGFLLEKLEPHHHHTFLTTVHERPYDPEILSYLKDHLGTNIEDEIRLEADKLVKMILRDLQAEQN
ncbi:MAG: hypothetical protein UW68_C0007G0023 [Candidatus Collierbacteria bacterium GW2011_GWB1_44_6]|uniref:Uncharacterized protein n=2 Tax=Candidatus Collieribacteriota TaxID=1752725 RepID=A0A0G1JQ82_9BACT|nr:MAG: hypothetical protein UV68_C0013G0009 [Candidatus Collierbacteria bacterium GW2011_GWC2_43_12]KKT73538.1 MAG: hypothetical protein UW68_C0007G0023 [Candidatus Collierbacteria bacterium GW2011_GWB1_44_6]KKT82811.1 MAG: hypothetical protein UW80_C0031G0012 [Microgenomates group bacterium GW2011_GWC1_44_9]